MGVPALAPWAENAAGLDKISQKICRALLLKTSSKNQKKLMWLKALIGWFI